MRYVRRRYGPSFLQLIGAVDELEVAIDSEDVTCAVSIIRGKKDKSWAKIFKKSPLKQIA